MKKSNVVKRVNKSKSKTRNTRVKSRVSKPPVVKKSKSKSKSKRTKSSKVKRTKSSKSKRTKSSKVKRGGAIRMPAEYFGKNSGKYHNKSNHTGESFPWTNLNLTL
jgi:hypothetical protein